MTPVSDRNHRITFQRSPKGLPVAEDSRVLIGEGPTPRMRAVIDTPNGPRTLE